MSISLSPDTQQMIGDRFKLGGYATADDLIRAALFALDQFDFEVPPLDEETRAAIDRAEAQIERGECRPWEEVRDEFLAKIRQNSIARNPNCIEGIKPSEW